jgi:hypothetical protein
MAGYGKAQKVAKTFGLEIDKDVVRRVLAAHLTVAAASYFDSGANTASGDFPTKYKGDSSSTESLSERPFPMMS